MASTPIEFVTKAESLYMHRDKTVCVVSPTRDKVLRVVYNIPSRKNRGASVARHLQNDYEIYRLLQPAVKNGDDSVDFLHQCLNLPDGVWAVDISPEDAEAVEGTTEGPVVYLKNIDEHYKKRRRGVGLSFYSKEERCVGLVRASPVAITDHPRLIGRSLTESLTERTLAVPAIVQNACDFVVNLLMHICLVDAEGFVMSDLSPSNLILQYQYGSDTDLGYILHAPYMHSPGEGMLTPSSVGIIDASLLTWTSPVDFYPVCTMSTRPYVQFVHTQGRVCSDHAMESLGWLATLVVAAAHGVRTSEWYCAELLFPTRRDVGGEYPTLDDALLVYANLGHLAAAHGAARQAIKSAVDALLGEIADYAMRAPHVVAQLRVLSDYAVDPDMLRTSNPRRNLIGAMRNSHFVSALRVCFGRLVATGDWDYLEIFKLILPPSSDFLRVVYDTANASLVAHGPILNTDADGMLATYCGVHVAEIIVNLVERRICDSKGIAPRVLACFDKSRRIRVPPEKRAEFDAQVALQCSRARLGDGNARRDPVCIIRVNM